jgi:hypothetical protein
MFRKYILRIFQDVETCFNDCDDIWVICCRKNAYIIEDAFGNKMKLQQSENHPAILTAYKSSDPRFVLYFLVRKTRAEFMPVEIYRLLSEDDRIKAGRNYNAAMNFNYEKITNAFIKKYEDLVYNSPYFEECHELINALIKINQSARQEKDRMKVPVALELKRLVIAPN